MNITERAQQHADSCRFCWMCRHVCPIGNATGQERNTARARALGVAAVRRNAENIENIIDNIYECSLCGACTNNCVTGWDPKIFVQEVKTDAILNGIVPEYIKKLLSNYAQKGNIYGADADENLKKYFNKKSDTLFIVGQDALYKSAESVKNACELLNKAGVSFTFDEKSNDTGYHLWFLTGKTAETLTAAKNCAKIMNVYKKVIVYDPVDLAFIKHQYAELGVETSAEITGFNDLLLSLLESGRLKVKNNGKEYTVQDNYAYARELDDCDTIRKIVAYVGTNKEMLLTGKEANLAGNLIMNEYMPNVQRTVALNRWEDAISAGCETLVTENPAEYELLKQTCPAWRRVISVEEMLTENM
ncbi:MAG: (Fe-S)-binding protein [Clostridia bacterium]|nr:(Fe-S)-binding protein [Clostridia bacterium]